MKNVSKTLYIPLYGKALVSQKGLFLQDKTAEAIWAQEGFPLGGKARSKWLAYFMGMRSAVFDRWVQAKLQETPGAPVLHIGCGLDSRILRTGVRSLWYDVDFPDVIEERKRFFEETETYRMLAGDAREEAWLKVIPPAETAVVVMEGLSMYLQPDELTALLQRLARHFGHVHLLLDCYTSFAAKASKYKNPINEVGVTRVYGLDDPLALTDGTGFSFERELPMTPDEMIDELEGMEKRIFKTVYGGKMARKLYRLYEYRSGR